MGHRQLASNPDKFRRFGASWQGSDGQFCRVIVKHYVETEVRVGNPVGGRTALFGSRAEEAGLVVGVLKFIDHKGHEVTQRVVNAQGSCVLLRPSWLIRIPPIFLKCHFQLPRSPVTRCVISNPNRADYFFSSS
jgi:hypothetical protein